MTTSPGRFPYGRVLLIHAHPDDETLATGVLIADLTARGAAAGVVTATRGEQGEIVDGALARPVSGEQLSRVREEELREALDSLGVRWHAYLGTRPARAAGLADRAYADSGMRWIRPGLAGPAGDVGPDALTRAPLEEVTGDIAAAISAYRPDAVVTYDVDGGYGHPDHVLCHHATVRACQELDVALWFTTSDPAEHHVAVEGAQHLDIVKRALRSHRTQLTVVGEDVVHSGGQREPILTRVLLRRA